VAAGSGRIGKRPSTHSRALRLAALSACADTVFPNNLRAGATPTRPAAAAVSADIERDRPAEVDGDEERAGMASATQDRIAALTQKMLRKKLFVVLTKPKAGPEKIAEVLPLHLEYMIGLEKQGLLFASGPLTEEGAEPRGDGLTILRAKNAAEARRLAEADPFSTHGLRTFEVREWTVMEGSLGLKVNLSDQSIEVA